MSLCYFSVSSGILRDASVRAFVRACVRVTPPRVDANAKFIRNKECEESKRIARATSCFPGQ